MRALTEYVPILAGLERAHPSLPLAARAAASCRRRTLDLRCSERSSIAEREPRRSFIMKAKRSRPDLVHAHFASGGRTALPLARALAGATAGHAPRRRCDRSSDRSRTIISALARRPPNSFVSRSSFAIVRWKLVFQPQKLLVHYIGIDRDVSFPRSSPGPSQGVLFVGRLVEKKGCEYLLRAMQAWCSRRTRSASLPSSAMALCAYRSKHWQEN